MTMTLPDLHRLPGFHDADNPSASEPITSDILDITVATPNDWRRAIDADPIAVPEQSPEWTAAIASTGSGRDVSRAYHFSGGRTLVLPLVKSRLGSIWSPPPAWGVGGLVGPTASAEMVRQVTADLRSLRASRVVVRVDVTQSDSWDAALLAGDVTIPRRSHVIDLPADPDTHFAQLSKSTRKGIRKSEKNGVRIEEDRTGALIETHYGLFLKSVARWSEKQHEPLQLALFRARRRDPIEKLQAMQRALGDRFLTLVAYVDDQPAASMMILLGKTSRDTRGAMDIDLAGPSNANHGLQWRALLAAYDHGSTRYHMGESGGSAGIADFKERFGALAHDHHEYRFERLPITRVTDASRNLVKRAIGFRDH